MRNTCVISGIEFAEEAESGATQFSLKVIPGASANEIAGAIGGALKLRISAAPEKGKANKAVIRFLKSKLGTSHGDIEILSGETSQNKRVRVKGKSAEEIAALLVSV